MLEVKFKILGAPMGKGRPRFKNVGKFVQTYTDKQTTTYENLVKLSYQQQVNYKFDDKEQLDVSIYAYFPISKDTSKKKKQLMLENKISPIKKPDCDNIAKIILDSLNNIAFKDDSQVVKLFVCKHYSDTPKVEVIIKNIDYESNTRT